MAVVVIVDDNEVELQSSLSMLKSTGQFEEIYCFNHPNEAYCFIKERGCDVLFMETEMKGTNCFVWINKLRKIKHDILFILVTTSKDYAYEAFQKGVVDYVLKPLSPKGVTKTLEKLKKYQGVNYTNGGRA